MRTLLIAHKSSVARSTDFEHLDRALRAPGNQVWLDIEAPQEDDIALLRERFHFHPLAIEDATRASERPKVDLYNDYYSLAFYATRMIRETGDLDLQPFHLFVGANYLVSIHDQPLPQVVGSMARWELKNGPLQPKIGAAVHALLDAVVDEYFPLMDTVADRVDELEDALFTKYDPKSLETIFHLKKGLLNMRRVVAPERDVLNHLLRRELPVFTTEDVAYLQDVYDHLVRVTDSVDTYRDLLSNALDSFLSVQSNRLNEVVKVLTIASIVLMSSSLIAGIYGMNFAHMPEIRWPLGYPWALGLMVAVSGSLILFFRWRKWL
jgi:magnesium transporter